MRILFVHQNFPGQYKHLAPALAARPGNQVMALAINQAPPLPGVTVLRYKPERESAKAIHPYVADIETKVIRGEAAANAARALQQKGFVPDVICAHPGWGEALFLKDVFPQARLLNFIEFHYQPDGADHGFDPEFPDEGIAARARLRMKNANSLLNLDACDWGLTPTAWQWSTIPEIYRPKVSIIHDGIDTDVVRPDPQASVALQRSGVSLSRRDKVITFVNRNLEPYRGFHVFMRALPEIQRRHPDAWVLILGGDEVSYGRALPPGQTYRQKYLDEVGTSINLDRVRFLGRIPYGDFLHMLQISSVHVYLTYPFVLSWSMLEAMAAGCLVVGSATPPVMEVIRDGENGLLVDFFSPLAIADAIDQVFAHPDQMAEMRARARQTVVERYDLKRVCLPRHLALVDAVAEGRLPPDERAVPPAAAATAEAMRRALASKQAKAPVRSAPGRR